MIEARLNFMKPVLDTFENEDIKEFAIALIQDIPDYIWHVGASSTGKYHPAYSLGEMGLMRHQIAVVRFINFFFELEQYRSKTTSRERDLVRLAGLVHDSRKSGSQEDYEKSKFTRFNHPVLMADVVKSFDGEYLNHDEIEMVAEMIASHMGAWNTDKKSSVILPKPNTTYAELVHLADYLASRKCLTMDFEGYVMESESPAEPVAVEFDENFTLTFGKYHGMRLIDVYKKKPDYVEWMEREIHRPEVLNAIRAMKVYLNSQEEDL